MHGRRCRKLRVLWIVAAWLPALVLASTGATPERAIGLLELMNQRLLLMPQVAAHKWHHRQPVEDPAREAVVVAEAREQALRQGLVPETVERLFLVQIDAAKAIQAYWIAEWQAGRATPPKAPDLEGVIRPELSRIGAAIILAAAQTARGAGRSRHVAATAYSEIAGTCAIATPFTQPGIDDARRGALLEAAGAVQAFPHRLAQILATGRLRIGTTGDYAPFSYREAPDREFFGIDIDLGRDLAAALGVEPEFVLTSWPALLDDLQAGRYDIAMSGVSRTLARQRAGFLSQPYFRDGKTPIARCAEADRLDTLEEIDSPGVTVVVNPGGTNERFVDENIRQAQKLLHPDNRTIFAELVDGRADVMFTDRIEVELQTRRHPLLCSTMAGNLTWQEKAYLLPQDVVWLEFVDTWLALRLGEGKVDATFAAHGFERDGVR